MAVALVCGFAIVTGLQLGRSLANLIAGAGWTWPDLAVSTKAGPFTSPIGSAFWTSLPGIVTGDSSAGLVRPEASSGRLAGPSMTWGCLIVTELLVVAALGWVAIVVSQRWGPGRMRGMASSAEAERMLGVTRLRKVAAIVRPDLYGAHANSAPTASIDRAPDRAQPTPGDAAELPRSQLGHGMSPWLVARRATKEKR